ARSNLCNHFESVFKHLDRIVVCKTPDRVLCCKHQEPNCLFIVVPFLEVEGEFRCQFEPVSGAEGFESLPDATVQPGPVQIGDPLVNNLSIEGVPELVLS